MPHDPPSEVVVHRPVAHGRGVVGADGWGWVMEVLFVLAWLAVGYGSFVYWWTNEHDLDVESAVFGVIPALAGPAAFLMGWVIHGGMPSVRTNKRVLARKRGASK